MANILIVDDDRQLIQHVRNLLTDSGHASDFVTRGKYLLPKLEREMVDLILLDVYMPGEDGLTLLKQIKAHPVYQAIPVIMLTSDMDEQMLVDCFESGATDFITKPIQSLIFKARLQAALATQSYIQQIRQENTKRQQAEETLRLYEEILENMAEGVYLINTNDGAFIYTNPRFEQMVGYEAGELVGRHASIIDAPGDKNPDQTGHEIIASLHETGKWQGEVRNIKKDGTPFWCQAHVSTFEHTHYGPVWLTVQEDITEQKRIKEALQESAQHYRQLFEGIGDAVLVHNKQGKFLDCNEVTLQRLGYRRAEFLRLELADIIHPDYRPRMRNNQEKLWFGEIIVAESVHLDKAGQTIPVEINARKIEYEGQTAILTVARDISERKQAEEELKKYREHLEELVEERAAELRAAIEQLEREITERRQVEQTLREMHQLLGTIFDHTHIMVAYLDPQFNFIQVNRAYAQVDDREPAFFPGRNHFDLYPHAENEAIFRRVVETKEPYFVFAKPFEYAEHPERGVSHWDWSLVPVKDENEAVTGLILTLQNVSERIWAAESLKQREKLLEIFFSQSLDGFFFMMLDEPIRWDDTVDKERVLDYVFAHQRITKVNEAMLAQYGAARDQFLDLTPADFFAHDIAYGKATWRSFFDQGRLHVKTDERTFDGTPMWIEGEYVCLYDEQGRITGHFGIQREITEQMRAEEQLKASLHEKEVLLKEIHHRVKNNMQIISSLLDLQADAIQDEQIRNIFRESQQRIKSMALIHERLYQSQDLARIDFAEYVESLTGHLLRSYRTKASNITLQLDIAPLSLSIEMAIPCGLIINELVSNAFKHAFPNGQTGQIWVELQPVGDQQVTLIVRDNGVGLSPKLDFRRATSLGLTLVMTLVKQIKGQIELESGHGTEFAITFLSPR